MIEAVTNEIETSQLGFDGRVRMRMVSAEDAVAMKNASGTWFKVKREGKLDGGRGAGVRLRSMLPHWYGGEWEVTTKAGEVFVRSVAA